MAFNALSPGRKGNFVYYWSVAVIAGTLFILQPYLTGGSGLRSVGSVMGIAKLGIVMGGLTFFSMLFRSAKNRQ